MSAMASDKRSYRRVADGTFSFGGGQAGEHGLHEGQVRGQPAEDQRDDLLPIDLAARSAVFVDLH